MHRDWTHYIRLLVIAFLGLLGLGFLVGYPGWVLAGGLLAYLVWTLFQVRRLHRWLATPQLLADPPESQGLWGDLFDGLYKLQRRQLRAQDRQQALINRIQESTNALHDAVIMTNARGELEWWNHAAERLLGFKPGTDRHQPLLNLVRAPRFKRYFEARDYREPLEIPSPIRPHIMLQFQINLFGEGDRLITVRDVTRLHQLEQMRRDFVSNVSHEMRTPLTVISGYLETLLDQSDELPRRWRRALGTMDQQTRRMEALITDLIQLSKLETDEQSVDDRETDMGRLLESIVQDARALSGENGHQISLELEAPRRFTGDESQLRSAFSNIIFNAIKYTPAGGHVHVSWWQDDGDLCLTVEDDGMGMDPIHIPRLTERFYRADASRQQKSGGTGLGLAIVKHVLLHHDGRLEVTSAPGEGSTFTCRFPASRALPATQEVSESAQ